MMTPAKTEEFWSVEHSILVRATPAIVWRFFEDTRRWRTWNSGVADIEMRGPFRTGSRFLMTLPDGVVIKSKLTNVEPGRLFVDETAFASAVISVHHRLEPAHGGTRVIYRLEARGAGGGEVGPAIAADFPDVLRSLARAAEQCAS
ncbi:polyketide cyclase / dehydrase and lipid transport [mine drainage metagenome]|uniref:Polyketide cyclase / dehydrase and lipid transport n=1 Tax=mine drainage metagenome TaxID=410659 RepID=A0A1J5RU96_9ZZZZ